MAYATADDVELRFSRQLEDAERTAVEERLDDAEELIRHRIPDLDEKIANGEIRERLVVMVECEAVLRMIRNPEGLTQETDGNYSYSISTKVSSGRLTIEPEEWRLLGVRASVALLGTKIRLPGGGYKRNPNWCFESGTGMPPCAIPESSEDCNTDLDTAVWG